MERQERRAQVLRHAKRIFARKGYHRTNIADIIARARIARGTFYLYFQNKRDIFEEFDHCLLLGCLAGVASELPFHCLETNKTRSPALAGNSGNDRFAYGTLAGPTRSAESPWRSARTDVPLGIDQRRATVALGPYIHVFQLHCPTLLNLPRAFAGFAIA